MCVCLVALHSLHHIMKLHCFHLMTLVCRLQCGNMCKNKADYPDYIRINEAIFVKVSVPYIACKPSDL